MSAVEIDAAVSVGWKLIVLVFSLGIIYAEFKSLKQLVSTQIENLHDSIKNVKTELSKDISRLEQKQERYNNLQERVSKSEKISEINSMRIDKIEERLHD